MGSAFQDNVPILYGLAYTTVDAVDSNGKPNGIGVVFVNDLESLDYLLSGLTHSTKYYIFLRCKNLISESTWLKTETTTDIPLTAEILGFSVSSPDF